MSTAYTPEPFALNTVMLPAQANRVRNLMNEYVGLEPVYEVRTRDGRLSVLTTELGALRLLYRYSGGAGLRVEYSKNLDAWVFSMPFSFEFQE